ncbi:hypothetical protein HII36_36990 [Nonomuraea sp. NN258]|uniref:hypothetical protein n=1 Tax=Nonomuraea antri TaxID=2730852 RepID=UPI0015680B02|nr:hypothetical protein [Nonomuraea antri]NRQ37392.1 hypothetical protein [Nonomuraea antri]
MRTRLPAALILLLSWFLPTHAQAQALTHAYAQAARQQAAGQLADRTTRRQLADQRGAAERVALRHGASRHAPERSGLRQEPFHDTSIQVRHGAAGAVWQGGAALAPSGPPAPRLTLASGAVTTGGAALAARRAGAAPARAPPFTRF